MAKLGVTDGRDPRQAVSALARVVDHLAADGLRELARRGVTGEERATQLRGYIHLGARNWDGYAPQGMRDLSDFELRMGAVGHTVARDQLDASMRSVTLEEVEPPRELVFARERG